MEIVMEPGYSRVDYWLPHSAFNTALSVGNKKLIKLMVSKGMPIEPYDIERVIRNDDLETLEWLVDTFHIPLDNTVILHEATTHPLIMEYLIEKNVTTPQNIMDLTAEWGNVETMKVLIAKGANIAANGKEVLNFAVMRPVRSPQQVTDALAMIDYLISQGADVHAGKENALYTAVETGIVAIVEHLIEKLGADIYVRPDLLDNAIDSGSVNMVAYLMDVKGLGLSENSLQIAANNDDKEMIHYLISQGADPDTLAPEVRAEYDI
jgi:ankyrin repeat protein